MTGEPKDQEELRFWRKTRLLKRALKEQTRQMNCCRKLQKILEVDSETEVITLYGIKNVDGLWRFDLRRSPFVVYWVDEDNAYPPYF